jgi:hypothetical protein
VVKSVLHVPLVGHWEYEHRRWRLVTKGGVEVVRAPVADVL